MSQGIGADTTTPRRSLPTREVLQAEANAFREHGYLVVPDAICPAEIALLQEECEAQLMAGPDREPPSHFQCATGTDGARVVFRVNRLQDKKLTNDSTLLLIGHPGILSRALAILGDDAIPYANDLISKGGRLGGPDIAPHRDSLDKSAAGYDRGILSIDVYLDDATEDNGCLWVLPGSHLVQDVRHLDAQAGAGAAGWDAPGLVPLPVRAGSVLFHDGMLLHGSRAVAPGAPWRRVVYPVMQSAGKAARLGLYPVSHGPTDRGLLARWMRLMHHAIDLRRAMPYGYEEQVRPAVPPEWAEELEAAELTLSP